MTLTLLVVGVAAARADDDLLVHQKPFDEIILKRSSGGEKLTTLPLSLPNRRVPEPLPTSGSLAVRLVSKPGVDLVVDWEDIASINLFEQLVLQEASRLVAAKKFDVAFDSFALLYQKYPETPGLNEAAGRYLQANALEAYQSRQYDKALAILLSYYERNPAAPGIGKAVDTVVDKILQEYVAAGNWSAARSVLDMADQQFKQARLSVVEDWRRRLENEAERILRRGAAAFRSKDYRAARQAANDATAILPDLPDAQKLFELASAAYPSVTVGVQSLAPSDPTPRIDLPESIRVARLARPTITELSGYTPEGGAYTSPLGRVALDNSGAGMRLSVEQPPAADNAYTLARWMLRAADPAARLSLPEVASITKTVDVEDLSMLNVSLNRVHVRPESLLRFAPLASAGLSTPRGYSIAESDDAHAVFLAEGPDAAVREVEERFFDTDTAALQALANGRVDLLARLMPWQIEPVRRDPRLAVGAYELPTTHVLIPTKRSRLLDQRSMRRALVYAINRQQILNDLIKGERTDPGFVLVSGPFPSGKGLDDPVRYGYNDGVAPRPYDPRLGAILSKLAWTQTQREEHGKKDEASRPFPTLRLAHGSDPIARGACQLIQAQLTAAGIPIELVELPADKLLAESPEFDLRYAELAVWEPLTDAQRVLGPHGVAGRCSDPMLAALDRLDRADNWPEVSRALYEVHALAAGDLPVLPLWQTPNFYAYRKDLSGVPESCVTLYQTIEGWRR
ncbi:MAG: hypothetical protein KDA37_02400 [Planctomycetales bacterium]|nr:hypothetical protein [Planctomycetales bacterium]